MKRFWLQVHAWFHSYCIKHGEKATTAFNGWSFCMSCSKERASAKEAHLADLKKRYDALA